MRPAYRPSLFALIALGAFAVAFAVGAATGWWPAAANEQPIGEVSRWCERVSGGWLREPVNTLGNVGFVVCGLMMFLVLARDSERNRLPSNRFIGNQPLALLYASAAMFLGPGSMVMHGSYTFLGAWVDNVSMVAFILIPWLLNLAALGGWEDKTFFAVYGSVVLGYALGYWFLGAGLGIGFDLFQLSIALWMITEMLYRFWSQPMRPLSGLVGIVVASVFGVTPPVIINNPGEYWWVALFWLPGVLATSSPATRRNYTPWFWAGLATFFIGHTIWTTGTNEHEWCEPDSAIQAHAIWHLLAALATWCFFKFLRTAHDRPAVVPARAEASS